MLRRRIFSSAMASVMALSSIAVVANAEETAVANVKTKEDLEAYVKSFDTFRASDIYEYGSISGEQFLNAIEYADNVLADAAASAQDYTVAYDMIESIYNRLKIYSVEELKALIATCKGANDRGNVLNEELNDLEYVNKDGQYDDFASAYSAAESVLDSSDARLITDAYEVLEAAYGKLTRMEIVTKAQFRTALKSYETMLAKEYDYEGWRRGAISEDWTTDVADYWRYKGVAFTYGALYDLVDGWYGDIRDRYEEMDQIKALNKTSDEDIVKAYNKANSALALVNQWKADDTDRATKANVTNLLEKYHSLLVFDYHKEDAEKLCKAILDTGLDVGIEEANAGVWKVATANYEVVDESAKSDSDRAVKVTKTKTTDAAIKIKNYSGSVKSSDGYTIFIPVDENGYWEESRDIITSKQISDKVAEKDGNAYYSLHKGKTINIVDLVKLDAKMVQLAVPAAAAATTPGDVVAEATTPLNEIVSGEPFGAWNFSCLMDIDATLAATEALYEQDAFKDLNSTKKRALKQNVPAVLKNTNKLIGKLDALITKVNALLASYGADVQAVTGDEAIDELIKEIDALLNEIRVNLSMISAAGAAGDYNDYNYAANYVWFIIQPVNSKSFNALTSLKTALLNLNDLAAVPNRITNNTDDNNMIDGGTNGEYYDDWSEEINANADYQVDLEKGVYLADFYLSSEKDAIKAQDGKFTIYDIDTNDVIGAGKAAASSYEWTLIHRYLKYALADKYDAPASDSYTKADVAALIDKAYELCEKTGDAALFEVSHVAVAEMRKVAVEWMKEANKDKMYKDWNSYNGRNATGMYKDLNDLYGQLEKEYNAFKYSFGEIADKIYLYEDMIDAEELEGTPELLAAIEETAYRLATVQTLLNDEGDVIDQNDAFTSDRFFQGFNRVFTNGDKLESLKTRYDDEVVVGVAFKDGAYGANASHELLKAAFEAMEAEVKKQTEVTVLKGDVNGDGVVNAFDASALLKNIVNSVAMDAAVADYDANGVVNALDASAILKAIVNA